MEATGAVYVARWTTYHVKQLSRSITELLQKPGFGFIEILSPCPVLYQRRNKLGDAVDMMHWFRKRGKIRNGAPTAEAAIPADGDFIIGKFVDRERPLHPLLAGPRQEAR
jgi:2-oxoglutarate ferredoxin oxidoreductase subunit beta